MSGHLDTEHHPMSTEWCWTPGCKKFKWPICSGLHVKCAERKKPKHGHHTDSDQGQWSLSESQVSGYRVVTLTLICTLDQVKQATSVTSLFLPQLWPQLCHVPQHFYIQPPSCHCCVKLIAVQSLAQDPAWLVVRNKTVWPGASSWDTFASNISHDNLMLTIIDTECVLLWLLLWVLDPGELKSMSFETDRDRVWDSQTLELASTAWSC